MIPETVTIVLPLPPGILSPNAVHGSYGGRMARYGASKKCRRLAKEATLAQEIESAPWDKAVVYYSFFHKQDRNRDDVNYCQSCKSYLDGIVEAGLLVDDNHKHLTTMPTTFTIDKKCPRVEIKFERKG
jgi:hypothetical protein